MNSRSQNPEAGESQNLKPIQFGCAQGIILFICSFSIVGLLFAVIPNSQAMLLLFYIYWIVIKYGSTCYTSWPMAIDHCELWALNIS